MGAGMGTVDGPLAEATALAESVAAEPVKYTADMLAWRLGLKAAERSALAITTIGAVDCSKAERLELRKETRRAANRARRAKLQFRQAARQAEIKSEASSYLLWWPRIY